MQIRNSVERRYAEFYQLYTRDFRMDIPIYLEFAAKLGGPVLEVGCRTGRVACQLAGAGHDVLAVDTERAMLEVGVDQVRPFSEHVRLADHDMRHQPTAERFPLVLVTLFTFNDLIDVEEQRLFLSLMRSCGICFVHRGAAHGDSVEPAYIAPDLLPERHAVATELAGRWSEDADATVRLDYGFDFLHHAVIRTLISEAGDLAGELGVYWRTGGRVNG